MLIPNLRGIAPTITATAIKLKICRNDGCVSKSEAPDVGLEPTTLRLRVSCSTDWANRANMRPRQQNGTQINTNNIVLIQQLLKPTTTYSSTITCESWKVTKEVFNRTAAMQEAHHILLLTDQRSNAAT